ncbi:hypothetical protein Misp01_30050 [Microtetraspora sp. NBRC 13810]|uniref:hypothetical protein n=1 Tax=Microtetraspora sp. NBRC 13810 TaxID=3030990 RepID=UPI0024A0F821|nr:hypothetical protein [Microtetraspora sp. NBRC 13810]GLW07875.1 hypothetical protein Misp01_30050 [Microtetraspora sp. NBRC 13810]
MAQLLRRLDDEVYIQYNMFGLDGTDLPEWSSPTDEIYHFVAAVRLESWDAEPGPADASWTPVSSTTFVAESGVVAIVAMMDGRGHDFLIGPPRFEYGVHMYLREPEPGDGHATGECDETWLLRFWPIRDVFDPITHAAPFSYIARGVLYYSIDLEPEQLVQPPARREVPVPVSAVADWASLRADPDLDTFDGWLRRLHRKAEGRGVTVHQLLREAGVEIEDGADLTPASCTPPRARAGRFKDPLIDRYYAEQARRGSLSMQGLGEDRLREYADGERIAKELCRSGSRTFSVPVEGRGALYVPLGVSRRVWRWEDDILGGELMDDGLTVDRQVLARNPWTRQILVSGIVTVLRRDHDRHGYDDTVWYVVRDAEPHEAARVLCAEATWEEDQDQRRALDEVAREKLIDLRATYRSREG